MQQNGINPLILMGYRTIQGASICKSLISLAFVGISLNVETDVQYYLYCTSLPDPPADYPKPAVKPPGFGGQDTRCPIEGMCATSQGANKPGTTCAFGANEISLALAGRVGPTGIRASKRMPIRRRATVQRVRTAGPDEPGRQRPRSHATG